METTTLSDILDNMNTWQDMNNMEEQFKVRQLDSAIRKLRRNTVMPWTLQKSTLRVFQDVLYYPVAADHDELAYVDSSKQDNSYAQKARFWYTSLQQFEEDSQNNRNQMAEIWDSGTKYIGIRYDPENVTSQILSNAETASDYTASDDASSAELDNVVYKEGNGSIKFTVTNSSGTATIKNTITSVSDTNYVKSYYFKWIYLDAVPTSIEMRLQTDDSNYLSTSVTTQFSGQALKADDWNLIAIDLNTATETGTFDSSSIASEKIVMTGAASGTYRVDASYKRQWSLMDYWYYSKYNCITDGASAADQEFFYEDGAYSTDTSLVGDKEWSDVVMYDAMLRLIADVENVRVFSMINKEREDAWRRLREKYPDIVPVTITQRYRFTNDFNNVTGPYYEY